MFGANWEKSQQRFEALWQNERLDRNTISIKVRKNPSKKLMRDTPQTTEEFKRFFMDEAYIYQMMMEEAAETVYYGDAFPVQTLYMGTCTHCAFTRKVDYSITPYSIWLHPVMNDISEAIDFDPTSDFYTATVRIVDYLAARNKGHFVIGNTDNCSTMDALASARGINNLLVDMIEEPETVEKQLAVLQGILKKTETRFSQAIVPANGNASATEFMGLWSKGFHHQLQCDMAAMISPDMFERFAVPELTENARWMGQSVYHLDGQEQIRFLDMILGIKEINLIQWTPVAGQPPTTAFIDVLKRIQAAGKGLVLLPQASEVPVLLDALSPGGVHYAMGDFDSAQEAEALVALVERAGQRA